jgi:YebC/PmpR family DNA-binding regulatory protein
MSGHSKWSTIKHKKAATDAKRGKIFTKLIRAITVAAKAGGGDPDANPSLRLALDRARSANMPKDSTEKAIKRGTGDLEGITYEEIQYEGYGPGGVALIIETLTDNKNRTVAEIRHILSKANGNLGTDGCVSWMFEKRGELEILENRVDDADELMILALDLGADDITSEDGAHLISCSPQDFLALKEGLEDAGFTDFERAEILKIPTTTVAVTGKEALKVLKLLDAIEDQDDVQEIYANADIDEESIALFQG